MGYYRCPQLCNLVHRGLARGLKEAGLVPGRDFLGLAVSVDPQGDPKSAVTNQRQLFAGAGPGERAGQPGGQRGERQGPQLAVPDAYPLVAGAVAEAQAARLADAVGFRYKYDDSKQFAHAAVAFVLTPEGTSPATFTASIFPPRDLRLALVEASGGRVGTSFDRVMMSCFSYDPMTQRYAPFVFGFVRIGALLSFAAAGDAAHGLLAQGVHEEAGAPQAARMNEWRQLNDLMRPPAVPAGAGLDLRQQVDHLHYFVIIVTMVSSVGDRPLGGLLLLRTASGRRTPRPRWSSPASASRSLVIGVPLFFFLLWFVRRVQGLRLVHDPAQERDGRLRHGQEVDVEVRLPRGAQRHRHPARAGPTARCAC